MRFGVKHGIIETRSHTMLNICEQCGTEFHVYRKQKYCNSECFGLATRVDKRKNCKQCGTEFISEPNKKRIYCTKECAGLSRRKKKIKKICPNCNEEFFHRACVPNTVYCSTSCGAVHKRVRETLKCKHCQAEFYPKKKTSVYCSDKCKYERFPRTGYKEVYFNSISSEEQELFAPMFNKKHRVHEHRLVMARYLNRPLIGTEMVHHLNGMKRDNRIENLELLESKKQHHTGYGDVYYQKMQEAEARAKKLEDRLKSLGVEV